MGIFSKKKTEKKEEAVEKTDEVKVVQNKKPIRRSTRNVKGEGGKAKTHGEAYKNLVRPIITEKVSFLGMYNQYVFEVSEKANKVEIKKSIESLYGVSPIKVNIFNVRGKSTRHGRTVGKRKNWKKAIITLKQGDKIDVYEGV
ncbi:MAG: 50S ribosomal protein L23 [Patescibacteria group bacterium]